MALLHRAELTPGKTDLVAPWVATRPWAAGTDASRLEAVASYRLDDPAGEVGLEALLVRTGDGVLLHVPVTFRAAPLEDDRGLIGTTQHSVLGARYAYDGCADPVFVAALVRTVLVGGVQAAIAVAGERNGRSLVPAAHVRGSGSHPVHDDVPASVHTRDEAMTTLVRSGDDELVVVRRPDVDAPDGRETLRGTWPGQDEPVVLAVVR